MARIPFHERSGSARGENLTTQPRNEHPVFNNTEVLTEGWYPALFSKELKPGTTATFKILNQRLVLFRSASGEVRALDAFCPHMGADLVHGKVEGEGLRCYFHRWKFGGSGALTDIPCQKLGSNNVKLNSYPVRERYGLIWVYSGLEAKHDLPVPPGLDGSDVDWLFLRQGTLFAHHHVMMANGLDLQHFGAVHGIDIRFDFEVQEKNPQVFDWILRGKIPQGGWRARFARWLLGDEIGYRVRVAGGTIAAISYGDGARFRGTGVRLPSLHILWGCRPNPRGVSDIYILLAFKKRRGLYGWMKNWGIALITLGLLTILKDDDIKAFPNMRFNTGHMIPADASVMKLAQMINRLPLSIWTPKAEASRQRSPRNAGAEAQP